MKKVMLMTMTVLAVLLSFAQKNQDKDVPTPVKASLQKRYPATKGLKWEKENGNYEAEFEVGETQYSVLIDNAGNILETEIEISSDALPTKAKEYVAKNYVGQKVKEAAKLTDAKGTVTYEAEVNGKDLIFDSNGNFIKEEVEKGNEED